MREKRGYPRAAIWLFLHLGPSSRTELAGDLIERFGHGESSGWLWREILAAIFTGTFEEVRRRWAEFCFALAGTFLIAEAYVRFPAMKNPSLLRMWAWGIHLPWPLSSAYDVSFMAAVETVELLALAIPFLAIKRVLGRVNVARGMLWSFGLFAAWYVALPSLRTLPHGYFEAIGLVVAFVALLRSAWAGKTNRMLT